MRANTSFHPHLGDALTRFNKYHLNCSSVVDVLDFLEEHRFQIAFSSDKIKGQAFAVFQRLEGVSLDKKLNGRIKEISESIVVNDPRYIATERLLRNLQGEMSSEEQSVINVVYDEMGAIRESIFREKLLLATDELYQNIEHPHLSDALDRLHEACHLDPSKFPDLVDFVASHQGQISSNPKIDDNAKTYMRIHAEDVRLSKKIRNVSIDPSLSPIVKSRISAVADLVRSYRHDLSNSRNDEFLAIACKVIPSLTMHTGIIGFHGDAELKENAVHVLNMIEQFSEAEKLVYEAGELGYRPDVGYKDRALFGYNRLQTRDLPSLKSVARDLRVAIETYA